MHAYNIHVLSPQKQPWESSFNPGLARVAYTMRNDEPDEETNPCYFLKVPRCMRKHLREQLPEDLDLDELKQLIYSAMDSCAWSRVLDLLNRRDYAEQELFKRLRTEGFSESSAQLALDKARDHNYVNDKRFVEYFVSSKKSAGWGQRKIDSELRQRGVDLSLIPGYPEEYFDSGSQYDRALELLQRKSVVDKSSLPKLVRFLASKGYPPDICYGAAKARIQQAEEDL